jgi:hypothetical protein
MRILTYGGFKEKHKNMTVPLIVFALGCLAVVAHPAPADAAIGIYYSVGTSTSALYSGNASASSGVLTLSSPANDNIGVGDEVRVGSNRYYITGRS